MKWPFGRGTTLLRGLINHGPWLLTTYKFWDDPPSRLYAMQVVKILEVARCFRTRFVVSLVARTDRNNTTKTHGRVKPTRVPLIANDFMVHCFYLCWISITSSRQSKKQYKTHGLDPFSSLSNPKNVDLFFCRLQHLGHGFEDVSTKGF